MKIETSSFDLMQRRGIYRILDVPTGFFYIGSTSTSFKRRLAHHVMTLEGGIHHNHGLQSLWNDGSGGEFVFGVLREVNGSIAEIRSAEQFFLDKSADDPCRLNIESSSIKNKRYIVTSPDGVEYFTDELPAFCKEHGLLDTRMRDCARRAAVSYKDWQCRYEGEPPREIDRTAKIRKAYILTTPDGVEFTSTNLPQVCKDYGLGWTGQIGLGKVARGQNSSYKGWFCKFADGSSPAFKNGNDTKRKSYVITGPGGEEFHVDNLPGFCQAHGLGRKGELGLAKIARGQQRSPYKGWLCRWA